MGLYIVQNGISTAYIIYVYIYIYIYIWIVSPKIGGRIVGSPIDRRFSDH